MNQSSICKNCGAPLSDTFCAHCGQKIALPLDSKRIFHDIWAHFVDLDFSLARSIRDLFLRPHVLIQNYIEGRRKTYTNPFKLLFIVSTLYFLAISFFDIKVDVFSSNAANEQQARQVVALMSYLVFLFLIPTTSFYQLIYGRKQMRWAEAYVSVAYIWSLYVLVITLLSPIGIIANTAYGVLRFITGALLIFLVTKKLYALHWFKGLALSIVFYLAYFLSTSLVMVVVITLSYLMGYEPLMFKPG